MTTDAMGAEVVMITEHSGNTDPISWELSVTRRDTGEMGEQSRRRCYHRALDLKALGSHWRVSVQGRRVEMCVENVLENNMPGGE